jgi:transcriptional repressor NrdR
MVIKKDGRRERFDRQKVLAGVMRACEKRPVSMGKMEQIVNEVESFVIDSPERERTSTEVGGVIMEKLQQLDKVAYIRFASVYRDFKDVNEFREELEKLLNGKESAAKKQTQKSKVH